jgi:ABC-type glycerol-3-phosphate transport system substrate-binding protein
MNTKNLTRREFLRVSALTAAGLVAAGCAPPAAAPPAATEAAKATEAAAAAKATEAAAAAKEIVLDVFSLSEWEAMDRELWDIFEEENPDIKISLFSHSEPGVPAYKAKLAGGYCPAMDTAGSILGSIDQNNYEDYVDLSVDLPEYPYWDQFSYDAKNAWSQAYGLPGPRGIGPIMGWVGTWMYHKDIMQKAFPGFDRTQIKTWDDVLKWLDEGTKWAKTSDSGVQFFWDQAWDSWWFGNCLMDLIPMAFPDGQREQQVACWQGKAKFNAPDSPYRHTYEFFKGAYDKGWIPENFWTRQWEEDMESAFAAKKSVVMLHGPWPWIKTLAADPTAVMEGMPATPPAEGQAQWMQWRAKADIDNFVNLYAIRACNKNRPPEEWEAVKKAFIWWNSPDTVRMRAENIGQEAAMKLDPPPKMSSAQYMGILKEIGLPGGLYENVQYELALPGEFLVVGKRKRGSGGVWEFETGNIAKIWADLMSGATTVQETLDRAQANWGASYEGLPE